MSKLLTRTCLALGLVLGALSAAPAPAQCGPDGLDLGPCCAPAGVTLPAFPAMPQENARFLCFDFCQPALNNLYCANLGPPLPLLSGGAVVCGQYNIRIQLRNCTTNALVWTGSVKAAYSRNWQESSVAGAFNLNVWRFVINGDFLPGPGLPNTPCDRPSCLNQYTRVYFTGYIDYARDCSTGAWRVAWALDHECDGIHHAPGTARPAPAAGFHPTRSFAMVGPGATFVVSSTGPARSNGPIVQEAMRWNNWAALPAICTFEERAQGSFLAQNEFCMCATAGVNQYIATIVNASGACGSAVSPSALGPFLQKRLGGWTSATAFPTEFVLFDFGYLLHVNGCTGTTSQEWFEGAETLGGYPARDFLGAALGTQFEDLASANTSATSALTRIGAPHVAYYLLNFNLP